MKILDAQNVVREYLGNEYAIISAFDSMYKTF
jgi:hypothetical protein